MAFPFFKSAPRAGSPKSGGRLIYAIGDVHGRFDLLKTMLAKLTQDYAVRGARRIPLLIFCGDYIDRGPRSAEVVETIIWLMENTRFEVRALKGNHEQGLLEFISQPALGAAWLGLGGAETLVSYGVVPPDPEGGERELTRARSDLLNRMPASHLRFYEQLELMIVVGDYAFVHAGVRPGVPLAEQAEQDLLWIRQKFLDSRSRFEKVIVHGHSWTSETPHLSEDRVGIDTGAYATGVLTALRLDDEAQDFIQAVGEAGSGEAAEAAVLRRRAH